MKTMSVLKRIKRIIASRCSILADSPECDMQSSLRQMEEAVCELRSATAAVLTEAKLIERNIKSLKGQKECWHKRAEEAVSEDRDDLARRALSQKNKIDAEINELIASLNRADENAEGMKEELRKAEQQFSQMQNRYQLMKHNQILAQSGVRTATSQVDNINDLEQRFKNLEAKAEKDLLQQQVLKQPSSEEELNEEFQALKKQVHSR